MPDYADSGLPDYDIAMYTIRLTQYVSSKPTNMLIAGRMFPITQTVVLPDYDIAMYTINAIY